jgi:hypothetical protein
MARASVLVHVRDAAKNIPAALQRFMAERVGARAVRDIRGASHAVSVSQRDEVAATIWWRSPR